MTKITDTVKHLIIINVILWVATQMALPQLQNLLALYYPANDNFGFWQFVTSMFMHDQSGLMHIAFNMIGLWMFGSALEQIWGRNKFLFFYFSTGIGAGLFYTAINYFQFNGLFNDLIAQGATPSEIMELVQTRNKTGVIRTMSDDLLRPIWGIFNGTVVGASGALYGVLVGFGMKFPNAKLALLFFPVPIAAKYFIPVLIAFDLISGLNGGSILGSGNTAHWAHIGGALFGLIIMLYWKKSDFKGWN